MLGDIRDDATLYSPKQKINIIEDEDDNMLLELAVESKANFLITGNSNDFTMPSYEGTKVVSPREYWESYK